MTAYTAADLSSRPMHSTIYIKLPGRPIPLRFTRTTEQHWKRTDGQADGCTWATHEQLANIASQGAVTNPFTGGTP